MRSVARLGALFQLTACLAACSPSAEQANPSISEVTNAADNGARYPFVVTAENKLLMSWLKPAGAAEKGQMNLVWASFDGENWSEPELIESSESFFVNWADFPSLTSLGDSPQAAHWLQKSEGGTYAYHVNMSFRSESGRWSQPIVPHQDQSATEHGFVSLVPLDQDRVFAIWLDGYKTQGASHGVSHDESSDHDTNLNHSMTLRSAIVNRDGTMSTEWEIDGSVCDCCQTAATRSGNRIIVVYRNRDADEVRDHDYAVFDLETETWSEPMPLSSEGWMIDGCPVNGPQIAASGNTVIATWYTAANDQPRTYMAVSEDGGTSFSNPEMLDTSGTLGRVGIAFNTSQVALLTWLSIKDDGAAVLGRFWKSTGSGDQFVIGDIDKTRASGFPRTAAVGEDFLVVWTEPDSGSNIRTLLVSPKRQ
ncbi:MAG TPA: hypothetical protein VJ984_05230 [Xanthomonadales bacterium]|nr:hypothetical protein [Xanthomonadales bacterium]